MANLQRLVLIDYPTAIFTTAAFLLSLISVNATPSFWPLVLLLTNLHLYIRIIHKRDGFAYRLFQTWFVIALAGVLINMSTAMQALSTSFTPLFVLAGMSLIESAFPLFVLFVDVKFSGGMRTPWAQIVLFPVLWATLWTGIAHINPIGRLSMWSPVHGFGCYEWLSPIAGPPIIDWAVAACAVVFSQLIGAWLMGPNLEHDLEHDREIPIIELDDDTHPSTFSHSEPRHVLALAMVLGVFTLPSFFIINVPLPPSSVDTTPLTVGCVLPSSIYDKPHASTLDDFIAASAQMTSAKILIWPEGAVTFANPKERDAAFDEVRQRVRGPAVGVSFEEIIPADAGERVGKRRNGFALLAPNSSEGPAVALSYYKRHLVPSKLNIYILPNKFMS
jgi:hypothetical protein